MVCPERAAGRSSLTWDECVMPRTCRNTFHPPAVITLSLNDLWVSEDSPTGLRFIASHQMHEIGWRHCVQCLQQVNKMQIFTQFLATDGKWLILAQYTKEVSIFVVSYLRLNNWYWSYHSLPWGYSKMLCGGTVGKIDVCRTSDGRTDSRFGISSGRERARFAWSCQIPERAKSCGVPLKCTALRLMILGQKSRKRS